MGQTNAERVYFRPRQTITPPAAGVLQKMVFTGYYQVGDSVDVVDVDALGNVTAVLADNVTIVAINPDVSITLNSSVDTTSAVGTPMLVGEPIDDVQQALDRVYRTAFKVGGGTSYVLKQPILGLKLNSPSNGQTTYFVADPSFWRAGDSVDVLSDAGKAGQASILSVSPNADDSNNRAAIVIDAAIDTTALSNPLVLNKTISPQTAIQRVQERIDQIDRPVENEDMLSLNGANNSSFTCYQTADLFLSGTSKLLLDGRRLKLGSAGTRASLNHGAGDAQLTLTSMILGADGNKTKLTITSGASVIVSMTGNFSTGYTVSCSNDGGVATAEDIADAINAHVDAKRVVQVQFGGNGTGTPGTTTNTPLTGGVSNGTGDYAELEQIYENFNTGTGYKWLSMHIRPNERNRLNKPAQDDEEYIVDYRRAADNAA